MSFRRLFRRAFLDVLDIPILLTTLLLLYLVNVVIAIPMLDAITNSLVELVTTGSVLKSLYVFYVSITDPLAFLSFLLTLIINVYLVGFIVARIWQKRTDKNINPFMQAFKRWIHTFVSLAFVAFLPFLFFLLYALYQAYPASTLLFALFLLSLIIWVPLALPVITSAVVETGRGRDIVYEGLLVGKLYWWKILLSIIIFSVIIHLVAYILQPLYGTAFDVLIIIFLGTLTTIWTISLSAEAYYGFKHGE